MKIFKWLFLVVVVFGMAGCATLVNQDTQSVVINSSNSKSVNATVIYKDGMQSGQTPFVALVRRANQPLVISVEESKCTKATTMKKNATISGAFFVNAIWCFSCVFSTTTDVATGRMWKYDEQIIVSVANKSNCDN
ncbi:MAG: hypothetical protein LBG21_02470 [Campylobacteraceae bacterium]|nr:hypothetical protein [Campylobacteraceae bacterium]